MESKTGVALDHKTLIRYQDGSPVHLINENSVAEANSLLSEEDAARFEVRNFRPNILIGNAPPHQEEEWLFVRFNGSILCKNVRLCTRCAIPTIDQDKGVKVDSKAAVLKNFRSANSEYENKNYGTDSIFGNNLSPQSSGSIDVGMSVDASFK